MTNPTYPNFPINLNLSTDPFPCTVIGIHGHAGAGKDTVAERVKSETEFFAERTVISPFAKPLRKACAKMFGLYELAFNCQESKEQRHGYWNVSPRQIAQFVGTELVRKHLGENFWLKAKQILIEDYAQADEFSFNKIIIIPDVRFQNEYDWIISKGGIVIHLTRPGAEGNIGIPNHESEHPLNLHAKEKTYEIVNDGTLEQLYEKVDTFIEQVL